ncbi:hypothetical protein KC207_12455 [Phycicoccus sp. BSK3Z-2]|uniref:Uncharacterized protein n=1 Tax=Phycicoccus avicenniae TaxID=2828860 RepID=A0A941D988_9MICO|nr:DUF6703 family protein [Phycicoccus avicenniae]MBR7744100.1 hypothetical protein [Phycicoccus avicenniae]
MSSLRESFERVSLPAITRLSELPRVIPFLVVIALVVAGVLLPPPGWLLLGVVALLLAWILALAWPRLSRVEKLMRIAVVALMVALLLTQAFPRG